MPAARGQVGAGRGLSVYFIACARGWGHLYVGGRDSSVEAPPSGPGLWGEGGWPPAAPPPPLLFLALPTSKRRRPSGDAVWKCGAPWVRTPARLRAMTRNRCMFSSAGSASPMPRHKPHCHSSTPCHPRHRDPCDQLGPTAHLHHGQNGRARKTSQHCWARCNIAPSSTPASEPFSEQGSHPTPPSPTVCRAPITSAAPTKLAAAPGVSATLARAAAGPLSQKTSC